MSQTIPETGPDYDDTRVIERPDGFYWQSGSGAREHGPFPTLLAALTDRHYRDDEAADNWEVPPDTEGEADVGIADWVDQETGQPAEEGVPRLEDH